LCYGLRLKTLIWLLAEIGEKNPARSMTTSKFLLRQTEMIKSCHIFRMSVVRPACDQGSGTPGSSPAPKEAGRNFDALFATGYRRLARLRYRVTGDFGRAEEVASEALQASGRGYQHRRLAIPHRIAAGPGPTEERPAAGPL
jgi:hypothetical protein